MVSSTTANTSGTRCGWPSAPTVARRATRASAKAFMSPPGRCAARLYRPSSLRTARSLRWRTGSAASVQIDGAARRSSAVQLVDGLLPAVQPALDRTPRTGRQPAHHARDPGRPGPLEDLRVGRHREQLDVERPIRFGAELLDTRKHILRGPVLREPPVPVREHPRLHGRALTADQDRRVRALGRLGPRPDALERHVLAVERGLVGGPDSLHRLDALTGQLDPGRRVRPVVAHLLAVPADPDPKLEPTAGQVIDAGHLLGRDDRVALDDQADAAADA